MITTNRALFGSTLKELKLSLLRKSFRSVGSILCRYSCTPSFGWNVEAASVDLSNLDKVQPFQPRREIKALTHLKDGCMCVQQRNCDTQFYFLGNQSASYWSPSSLLGRESRGSLLYSNTRWKCPRREKSKFKLSRQKSSSSCFIKFIWAG